MTLETRQDLSGRLFTEPIGEPGFAGGSLERVKQRGDSCSQLVDIHSTNEVRLYYLRVASEGAPQTISISSAATINRALEGHEFGLLLRVHAGDGQYTLWLPSAPTQLCFDQHQRIVASSESIISYQWEFQPHIQLRLLQPGQAGGVAVAPYVVLRDPEGKFFRELGSLSDLERRLYRKSNWFFARTSLDIWSYLINGSIYDPRSHKKVGKRFKCQQCAYAWWSYFDFLYQETGKKIYTVMQDEVALTVLLDMSAEGAWRHGFWSDDMETHARFHLDGLHLLISQYQKTGEPMWLEAAERGMAFVSEHLTEQLDDGSLWFLHDTIEYSRWHHFKSTLFGKTLENSLCINTHVQALTVLHRLRLAIPDKKIYTEMLNKGLRALHRALDYQPGELFYRPLMFWIMKHKTRGEARSKLDKLRNRLEKRLIKRIYWLVRRQFPRLVQPGGFTERDLTLSFASDRYHIINLKDLLTLYQQEPLAWLRPYIKDSTAFVRKFVRDLGVATAVERSPYYIELIDILYLYDKLIEPVPPEEMSAVEEKIYQQMGGYSLDYYASELVQGR